MAGEPEVERLAGELADRGWWLQVTHTAGGGWTWVAGDAKADLIGGNAATFTLALCDVERRLDEGRFGS